MRNFFYLVIFGLVITLAYWAYQENVKTQMAIKKSEEFQIEIGKAATGHRDSLEMQILMSSHSSNLRSNWSACG